MRANKLNRLADRTPVKLMLKLTPELHQGLVDYAAIYNETYGQCEPVADLVTYVLALFLARRARVCQGAQDPVGARMMANRRREMALVAGAYPADFATAARRASTFYSPDDVASHLALSTRYLAKMRQSGSGPAFHKRGRRVFYRSCDIEEWVEGRRCDLPSDPDGKRG